MALAHSRLQKSRKLVLLCLAIGIGYFLAMRHWQHLLEFLPYLILLACPLMHLFGGHGGHGGHEGHHENGAAPDLEAAYRRGMEEGRKQRGD